MKTMIPYKHDPSKKLPGKAVPGTVFSTAYKAKKKIDCSEFGEEFFNSHEDPFGMYTGHPADKNDTPMQDADDL